MCSYLLKVVLLVVSCSCVDHQEEDASLTSTIVKANIALQFLTWRKQLHRVTKKLKLGPSVLSHHGGECQWVQASLFGSVSCWEDTFITFLLFKHLPCKKD